jgi:hypothetical protein
MRRRLFGAFVLLLLALCARSAYAQVSGEVESIGF